VRCTDDKQTKEDFSMKAKLVTLLVSVAIGLAIVLSGCKPAALTATPVPPTPTAIPPTATLELPTSTPIPPTATPELPTPAVAGIGECGVSFQYDPYLAAGIHPQIVDAFTEDNGMNYLLLPQHLSFTFLNSYADAEPLLQRQQLNLETMPQIVVYPVAAYSAMHHLARVQIEQLQAMLAAQPSTPGGTMPYLPLHNAAQVFHSQVAYLAFTNGAGVRYVTAFSQDASPLTNQHLIYTFQGLTDDGRYYVAAFFPVKTAVLPDTVQVDDWEAFSVNYSTYVAETKAALNDLTLLDFTPDFTLLDAVVASLRVEPDVELRGAETAVFPDKRVLMAPTHSYSRETTPSN
jgi:hypothetical protein